MLTLLAALVLQADPRMANAYREDQAGWHCVHLGGSPSDIGYQYGVLMGREIDDAQKALRDDLRKQTGKDWDYYRDTSRKLFWDKVPQEYQDEMVGQAQGLQARGFKYDQWDVLALNAHIEVSQYYLPWSKGQPAHAESCSAFVATGDETSDGKVVMAHNMWWDLEMGERFDEILDIRPTHGHRIMMDALPGFIHSGTDFAVNDAGIMLTETTLPTINDFDPNGIPEFVRMRDSIQYSDSLESWANIMRTGNNGGYANTWLVADRKTGEIGKLEEGLKNVTWQTTKNGYYVGSNFPENPKLIQEEVSGWDSDPRHNGCEARRMRWNQLLTANKSQVDANLAKKFLGDVVNPITGATGACDATLCGRMPDFGATNAKVMTSDLAANMSFWGRMGAPDGAEFDPTVQDPYAYPMLPNPWTLLAAGK
jgi:hypothetical protein